MKNPELVAHMILACVHSTRICGGSKQRFYKSKVELGLTVQGENCIWGAGCWVENPVYLVILSAPQSSEEYDEQIVSPSVDQYLTTPRINALRLLSRQKGFPKTPHTPKPEHKVHRLLAGNTPRLPCKIYTFSTKLVLLSKPAIRKNIWASSVFVSIIIGTPANSLDTVLGNKYIASVGSAPFHRWKLQALLVDLGLVLGSCNLTYTVKRGALETCEYFCITSL